MLFVASRTALSQPYVAERQSGASYIPKLLEPRRAESTLALAASQWPSAACGPFQAHKASLQSRLYWSPPVRYICTEKVSENLVHLAKPTAKLRCIELV